MGRPPGSTRFAERQREVVAAAASAIARRGYHATTIDDLVEATGLTRGGLYHYIGSKHTLLLQIHQRFIDPLLAEAEEIEAAGLAPDATLERLAVALMETIARYRDEVTVFLHEWRTVEDDPGWEDVRAARRRFEDVIARVLERGVAEGVMVVPNVRLAVLGFLGMFNYSYQWLRAGGRATPREIAESFVAIFLRGVVAGSA